MAAKKRANDKKNKRVKRAASQQSSSQPGSSRAAGGEESDDPRRGFPIVGIGASAGGLTALQQLLAATPAEPGIALVIIQHLDPTKTSLAPELLAKHTQMHVAEVNQGWRVEPNHVYVIPPDKYLSIADGRLRLTPPDQPRGTRMAVDFFLRSLADDQQHCAVGVILSGTGTDGSLGVKAVIAAGGLVIAQEPTTADFDGMPRSAIATGVVDHVRPVAEIPDLLIRYSLHSYVQEATDAWSDRKLQAPGPALVPRRISTASAASSSGMGVRRRRCVCHSEGFPMRSSQDVILTRL